MGYIDYLKKELYINKDMYEFLKDRYSEIYKEGLKYSRLIFELKILSYMEFVETYCSYKNISIEDVTLKSGLMLDKRLMRINDKFSRYIGDKHLIISETKDKFIILSSMDSVDRLEVITDLQMKTGREVKGLITLDCILQTYKSDIYNDKFVKFRYPMDDIKFLLMNALELGSTDIHLSPVSNLEASSVEYKIQYRIHSSIEDIKSISKTDYERLISSLVDIVGGSKGDANTVQGFTSSGEIMLGKIKITIRLQIGKSVSGVAASIRIIPEESVVLSVNDLGFSEITEKSLKNIIRNPKGFVLVTGKMGSGKNTTIYALLKEIHKLKIEEYGAPIEVKMPYVQKDYEEDITVLKKLVTNSKKSDVDIIFISEIPDREVGDLVSELVNSNIGVFTTTHIDRVWNFVFKFQSYFGRYNYKAVMSRLSGIVNQSMFKKVCTHCRVPVSREDLTDEQEITLWENLRLGDNAIIYRKSNFGCKHCMHGYEKNKFRPVAEVVTFNSELLSSLLEKDNVMLLEDTVRDYVYENKIAIEYEVRELLLKGEIEISQVLGKHLYNKI